jgi:hypothetical protein
VASAAALPREQRQLTSVRQRAYVAIDIDGGTLLVSPFNDSMIEAENVARWTGRWSTGSTGS